MSVVFWSALDDDSVLTFLSFLSWLTSVVGWLVYLTLKCLSSFLHLLVNPRNCLPLKDGATNFKLPNNAAQDQAARTLLLLINAVVIASPPFGTVRLQFVRLPRHDEAMVQPASRSDYVRQLASSVRARYNRMRMPHQASASRSHSTSSADRSSSALFNFPPRQEGARFNAMNGVNILNLLPIPCRSSKESLIGALSAISSLAGMVLLTCSVSDCFTRQNDRSFLATIWFSCIVHNVCSRRKIPVARCS